MDSATITETAVDSVSISQQAIGYLAAAVVSVPIAQRLGLGSVLGYLIAGAIIGPYALNVVGERSSDIMHVAEFGVILTLFIIGLELHPATLWRLRGSILGLGGLQVLASSVLLAGVALIFGLPWQTALASGLILSLSSTAIVLQSLKEKGLLKTPGGEASFAVLLFQDLAVIPMLAILPLLALNGAGSGAAGAHTGGAWTQVGMLLAVVAIVVAGRFIVRPWFRFIAKSNLAELFTASALLMVVSITVLMHMVGLSPSLGAFVGGVVLADSEYRHQLEADIAPFKGLLLGLFFIAVGASIDFGLIAQRPLLVFALVAGLVLVKFFILWALGAFFKLGRGPSILFSVALAQGCEFAFVLLAVSMQYDIFTLEVQKLMVATVALSMAATPVLLMINERFIQPRLMVPKAARDADEIDEKFPILLAGFGRFGNITGRFLRANGLDITVLDFDSEQVDLLRKLGLQSYYGDASRLDMLRAAGIEEAKLLLVMIDNEEKANEIVESVQRNFPKVTILARALSRAHAYELIQHGVDHVFHESLGSALDLGSDALKEMGRSPEAIARAVEIFRDHEKKSIWDLAKVSDEEDGYISRAREHIENLRIAMEGNTTVAKGVEAVSATASSGAGESAKPPQSR